MREGNRLSAFFLLLAIFLMAQKATYLPVALSTLGLVSAWIVLWSDLQMRYRRIALIHHFLCLGLLIISLLIFCPPALPAFPMFLYGKMAIATDNLWHQSHWISGFFREMWAYATDVEKLDFNHWVYFGIAVYLLGTESLAHLHKSRYKTEIYGLWMIACAMLWFTYVDVWSSFALFFIAFAMNCLTEQEKGLIFGAVLPVTLTTLAILAASATPVEQINERLSAYTTVNDWLRSGLKTSTTNTSYGIGAMGFYPMKDRLGGPVQPSKELAFRMRSNRDQVYLRTRVLTHYENNQWREEKQILKAYAPHLKAKGKKTWVGIEDFQLKTNVVPSLLNTYEISVPSEALKGDAEGILWRVKHIPQMETGQYEISAYLDATTTLVNEKAYLQLPKQYAPKVVAFTQKLVASKKSPSEKVAAIKAYLLSHYTYQLAMPVPPKDRDFVDYFLFDEKEGYCVYFATAVTVMARISGVPSRYVEGFVSPRGLSENKSSAVTGERAHAWSEVFYEGAWHIVEATPSFATVAEENKDDEEGRFEGFGENLGETHAQSKEKEMAIEVVMEKPSLAPTVFYFGGLGLLILFEGIRRSRLKKYFYPVRHLSPEGKTLERFLCERYTRLILQGLKDTLKEDTQNLSVRELLRYAQHQGMVVDEGPFIEIMEQSLYDRIDSPYLNQEALEKLVGLYRHLDRTAFNWQYRVWRNAQIAWKGRLLDGSIDG